MFSNQTFFTPYLYYAKKKLSLYILQILISVYFVAKMPASGYFN